MRVRETWHAFCYPESNQRNSFSINHLGAPQARKVLALNDLQLGTLLEYLLIRLGTLSE